MTPLLPPSGIFQSSASSKLSYCSMVMMSPARSRPDERAVDHLPPGRHVLLLVATPAGSRLAIEQQLPALRALFSGQSVFHVNGRVMGTRGASGTGFCALTERRDAR